MSKEQVIVASIHLPQPPKRVWEYLCDTSRYSEWVESTLKMVRVDGPARLGATYQERTRISGPWKSTTTWRITEFDSPHRQVHEGVGVATAKNMSLELTLNPEGDGTHLTMTIRYTPRFGPIGVAIDRAVAGKVQSAQQRSALAFGALLARESVS